MDEEKFAGVSFTKLLQDGMKQLHEDLKDGSVYKAAKKLFEKHGGKGFKKPALWNLLALGNLKYGRHQVMAGQQFPLIIHGMTKKDKDFKKANARADIGGDTIEFNFYKVIETAKDDKDMYPRDFLGQTRLQIRICSIILHEVMHNQGFKHPDHPGTAYDPDDDYFRTLPEVVEAAYLIVHKDKFPKSKPPFGLLGLTDGELRCVTES
jgi:hypothetical protein